ncbi:MAG: DUF962 domain-containing protein [Alphaproteobacteria bacterium]
MTEPGKFNNYSEFWPYYLQEHSLPRTRNLHFAGTALALVLLLIMILSRKLALLPLVLVAGYGPAWIGHYFIEHNRPATFKHPLWSLVSDFRMFFCWISGKLGTELEKAGVTSDPQPQDTQSD